MPAALDVGRPEILLLLLLAMLCQVIPIIKVHHREAGPPKEDISTYVARGRRPDNKVEFETARGCVHLRSRTAHHTTATRDTPNPAMKANKTRTSLCTESLVRGDKSKRQSAPIVVIGSEAEELIGCQSDSPEYTSGGDLPSS